MSTFEELQAEGKVRFRVVSDSNRYDDSFLESQGLTEEELNEARKDLRKRIENEGVWGIVGQVACPTCGHFETVDSCWGFIGAEWKESGYAADIKDACVRKVENQ